jgi:O-antigen/teichoic acid export membrane protein
VSATKTIPDLTSGRLLARNTVWNVLGQLAPMAVAVATVPVLVRRLGVSRFGVLSLAFVLIGYFSLFDLGLGRALTKLLADKLAAGQEQEHGIPPLIWTSLLLMVALGIVGGLGILAITPWMVRSLLRVPPGLQQETLHGFYLLALSIPVVILTSGLRGILEALQQFRILNLIRIPMSIFSFAGPLLVLPFTSSLFWVIVVLVAGRVIGCVVHWVACSHALPAFRTGIALDFSLAKPLVKFGGWMTVSNVLSPLLTYTDRFFIGALISIGAIAYYTTSFDTVTRVSVIPAALSGVLFPAFAVTLIREPGRAQLLLDRSLKYLFLIIFPVVLITVALAPEGLRLWLGPDFAEKGTSVLRWLAAGVLINSLAYAPFALIQSAGRPDITAKLHLLELPIYGIGVWLLSKEFGIRGTAIAWTARLALDTFLICFSLQRLLPNTTRFLVKVVIVLASGLLLLCLVSFPASLILRIYLLIVILAGFGLLAWFAMLSPAERMFLLRRRQATVDRG